MAFFMNSTTIYNVTQINNKITYLFDKKLSGIFIKGEVSSFTLYQSGHAYFSLKDEKNLINCVFFNYQGSKISDLKENIEIVAYGNINIYKARGRMQFVVSHFHIGDDGLLWKNYLKLKGKLEKEGLFDFKYKKKIPDIPEKVALICSKTGSVIHDILSIIHRRSPYLDVLIKDSLVQGKEAVRSIVLLIQELNAKKDIDLIIIARGGGSLEDMMPFNDEVLVREIFNSSIPIITAIGHETDFTLSDFCSDKRAATPSEAAEICAPDIYSIYNNVYNYQNKLSNRINTIIHRKKTLLDTYSLRILSKNPKLYIQSYTEKLVFNSKLLINSYNEKIKDYSYLIDQYKNKLSAYDVNNIKNRGFFIIKKNGSILTSRKQFKINDYIDIESNDTVITAKINKVSKKDEKK